MGNSKKDLVLVENRDFYETKTIFKSRIMQFPLFDLRLDLGNGKCKNGKNGKCKNGSILTLAPYGTFPFPILASLLAHCGQ